MDEEFFEHEFEDELEALREMEMEGWFVWLSNLFIVFLESILMPQNP